MVQYIITPWRNRSQLLSTRSALYPSKDSTSSESALAAQRSAVALISVWVQRGNCPHLIESTALLVSARLNDTPQNSTYAVRAAYSAAFCRFVTGLLDGYQESKHKLSMYSIAKNVGLPASFVEMRHQCTHEELPDLRRLRRAGERALGWIWERYWAVLEAEESVGEEGKDEDVMESCRVAVGQHLRADGGIMSPGDQTLKNLNQKFGRDLVLEVIMEYGDSEDVSVSLRATKLAAVVMSEEDDLVESKADPEKDSSLEDIRADLERAREALEIALPGNREEVRDVDEDRAEGEDEDEVMHEDEAQESSSGWHVWKGPWVPKPIGVV